MNRNISAVIPFTPVNLAGNTLIQGERAVAPFYRESVGSTRLQKDYFDPTRIQRETISAL